MVSFQTKNPNLGKFWRAWDWKLFRCYGHLEYFIAIWEILWPFGTFFVHMVHFLQSWYHAPRKIWQPWLQASRIVYIFALPFVQKLVQCWFFHFLLNKRGRQTLSQRFTESFKCIVTTRWQGAVFKQTASAPRKNSAKNCPGTDVKIFYKYFRRKISQKMAF
jgi:hypothetical protein